MASSPRSLPGSLRLALFAAALAACSENASVVGGRLDAAADTAPPDQAVALDAADDLAEAPDVAAPDVAADVAADAAPDVAADAPPMDAPDGRSGCSVDGDCAATPMTPACDAATRTCVACVPASDRCARGSYCEPGTLRCAPGCRNDDDCMGSVMADASVTPRHCDLATRACQDCVTAEHCPAGALCVGNTCVAGCTPDRPCPTGQTCCGGACVDPQANTAHCGRCDARCVAPNATPACMNGTCAVATCTGTFADCDRDAANGCETPTLTDVRHCGACGAACAPRPDATAECAGGRCAYTCAAGSADCDGDAANGCEVDTRTSVAGCGACGRACAPANATAACVAGACNVARCNDGFGDCDANATNGCETDLRATVASCGACGRACPAPAHAVPACVDAVCAVTCAAGFGECNAAPADGCETDLGASVDHCGSCGRSCVTANVASAECATGACRIVACASGFADCDANAANGCETDVRVSTTHCGRCGNACSAPGGTAVCRLGVCGVGACASGRGDCDGDAANGCETDLTTSAPHCGACGAACAPANATGACVASACTVAACAPGFGDCDVSAANGCEVDTRTATASCGACGRACSFANGTAACAEGTCRLAACNEGFGNCDGDPANGCETDTRTSAASCGTCGRACSPANATGACVASACAVAACASGFGDCDATAANGCEVATSTSNANCGACGRACTVGQACVAGACSALASCAAILAASPAAPSGTYVIDPDGVGGAAPFSAYCDMASDGGGWTLLMMGASTPTGTFGYDAAAWTDTTVLNAAVTDPAMNVSVKSPAFNGLPFAALRLCLGSLTACLNEPVTAASARALFGGAERLGVRSVGDFRTWGYAGNLGCNRSGFNVFDVGGGAGARARCRYGILLNNESTCEGSVDGGRGLGCRGFYGTQISAGQGDGIVGTSHERGWIFGR